MQKIILDEYLVFVFAMVLLAAMKNVLQNSCLLKVGLSPFEKNFFICLNDSPSKMMKKDFYFILKALFVLKVFKFLFSLFGHVVDTIVSRKTLS